MGSIRKEGMFLAPFLSIAAEPQTLDRLRLILRQKLRVSVFLSNLKLELKNLSRNIEAQIKITSFCLNCF